MGIIKDSSEELAINLSKIAKITLIAAINQNNIIGINDTMAWSLKGEQTYFKYVTMGGVVIMGKSTYEDIPLKNRELPGRHVIILTTDENYKVLSENHSIAHSFEEAIHQAKLKNVKNIFIAGGGKVYEQAVKDNLFDTALITEVELEVPSAERITFFPQLNKEDFNIQEINIKGENWKVRKWTRILN